MPSPLYNSIGCENIFVKIRLIFDQLLKAVVEETSQTRITDSYKKKNKEEICSGFCHDDSCHVGRAKMTGSNSIRWTDTVVAYLSTSIRYVPFSSLYTVELVFLFLHTELKLRAHTFSPNHVPRVFELCMKDFCHFFLFCVKESLVTKSYRDDRKRERFLLATNTVESHNRIRIVDGRL